MVVYHGTLAQMFDLQTGCREHVTHFLLDCPFFRENSIDSIWLNIKDKVTKTNSLLDGTQICSFINNLSRNVDRKSKVMLLLGGLSLPFDDTAVIFIKRFISSEVR